MARYDDSIHREMEQILQAYGLHKEIVVVIMMLNKNMKVKVRSTDRDIEFFDIVAGVLQGDTLAPYLFIICLDYVLRTSIDLMKENDFTMEKSRSRRCPTQTIADADHGDDIALLANVPAQAEFLLHNLEKAAGGIGLHVNAKKKKRTNKKQKQKQYMCFNQNHKGDISTLKGGFLKLVDKFTYLGRSVSSTENDINT